MINKMKKIALSALLVVVFAFALIILSARDKALTDISEEAVCTDVVAIVDVEILEDANVPEVMAAEEHSEKTENEEIAMNEEITDEAGALDRSQITNLKGIDPLTGKVFSELIVTEIREYSAIVTEFSLSDMYSPDYTVTLVSSFGVNFEYLFAYTDGREIIVAITIFESVGGAQEAWVNMLLPGRGTSHPSPPAAESNGIFVGDAATGDENWLIFIRGNIRVRINGFRRCDVTNALLDISVVEMAQKIDAKIVAALEEAELGGHADIQASPKSSVQPAPCSKDDVAQVSTLVAKQEPGRMKVYGDEAIIAARVAAMSAAMHSIGRPVVFEGVAYTFAQREFAAGFAMVVPECFEALDDALARLKYPDENRPRTIISNADTTINLAFDCEAVGQASLESRLTNYRALVKKLHPSYVFFSESIHDSEGGLKVACYDFRGSALDGDIYYLNFFADLPNGELFGWFSCPIESQPKWEPLVRQMIQTIVPLPQDA